MHSRRGNKIDQNLLRALEQAGFSNMNLIRSAVDSLSDSDDFTELVGIDKDSLKTLINQVELMSIHGLGTKYVNLLRDIGITTAFELGQCNPYELQDKIRAEAEAHQIGRVPNRATLEDWIEQAAEMSQK